MKNDLLSLKVMMKIEKGTFFSVMACVYCVLMAFKIQKRAISVYNPVFVSERN